MSMKIPDFVALEITSRCQLKCKGCFSRPEDYPKGDMDLGFFKSVIDRMDPRMRLNPYANGEPLLHPNINEMIRYASEKNIKNYITTNGMIWNEKLFRYIFEHPEQCYQLIVSLDGLPSGPSRSIELARPGSNREKILQTIDGLQQLKRSTGSKTDLMVKICERGQDYEEIEEYISYWLERGMDAVIVGRLFTNFKTEGMRIYPCQYSDPRFMLIRWDRSAVACMYQPDVMNHGALPMGVLDEKTPLVDFFNNEKYTEFRERQAKGDFPHPCNTCGISYTGTGMKGVLTFRNPRLTQRVIFHRHDHYNAYFSFVDKGNPNSSYGWKP